MSSWLYVESKTSCLRNAEIDQASLLLVCASICLKRGAHHKQGDQFLKLLDLCLDGVTVGGIGLQASLSEGLASLVHGPDIASHLLFHCLPIKLAHGIMHPSFVVLL